MILIRKLVKVFDIYGNHFNLRINNQSKFKSEIGGILSIMTIAILIFCVISFGKDFYKRDNPKILQEDGIFLDKDIPTLNSKDFNENYMVFKIDKKQEKNLQPSLEYTDGKKSKKTYLKACSKEILINNSFIKINDTKSFELFSHFCIRLNDDKIGGIRTSDNYYPNIFKIENCADIKNDDIIKYNLTSCDKSYSTKKDNLNLYLLYFKIGFNPKIPNPFIKKLISQYFTFEAGFAYNLYLPLNLRKLIDDIGWIVESFQEYQELSLNSYTILSDSFNITPYPNINFIIHLSDEYRVYNRSYNKIQELFASIGGFMKLVITILNCINFYVRCYLVDSFIINQHFCFRDDDSKSNQSGSVIAVQNSQNSNNKLTNNYISKLNRNNEQQPNLIKTVKNPIEEKNTKIDIHSAKNNIETQSQKISVFLYLNVIFQMIFGIRNKPNYSNSKKLEDIKQKIKICDKIMDFTYISNKLIEIDTLKSLFLNDVQSLCFRYIQKPKEISKVENPYQFANLLNTDEENISTISDYFIKLLNEEPLSGHDEFLFRHLDEKIKTKIVEALAK